MADEIVRTVNDVRNPIWLNAEHTQLDCEVDFDELDEVYVVFTADPNDVHPWGKTIFDACVAGTYGAITEFDAVAAAAAEQAAIDRDEAGAAARTVAQNKLKAGTPLTDDDLDALGLS